MPTVQTTTVDFSKLLMAEQPTGAHSVLAFDGTYLFARTDGSLYQSIAPNLIPPNSFFASHVFQYTHLIVGHTYRWIQGTTENNTAQNTFAPVSNGGSPGNIVDFVAVGSAIVFFTGTAGAPIDFVLMDVTSLPAGTIATPPFYLYSNSRIMAYGLAGSAASSAFAKWTDNGNTAAQQHVDVTPLPGLVSNGTLTVPCRGDAGLIEFEEHGTLLPGQYRLMVESGNIGQTDPDFAGFAVEVTVNSAVLEEKLLKGRSGFNVRGFDQFDFTVRDTLIGDWLLSFLWTNPFSSPATGAERQLAVYSYSLRRLATELFRVDISATGSTPLLTQLDTGNFTSGTTPGGWLLAINSYGTLVSYAHESQVYSANDTIVSNAPLSGVLTGLTAEKREDLVMPQVEVVASDPGSFSYPSLGAVSPVFGTLYQTGSVITFSIPQPSGTNIYSYAWRWWDGTSQATTGTSVTKELNIGGVPSNGSLAFNVTPVAIDGQAKTVYGAIKVNNPPFIAPSPTISVNDAFVPFFSKLSLYAFDVENNSPLIFTWLDANSLSVLSATGTAIGTATVAGTWTGNGTTIINNYTAYGNYYNAYVTGGEVVRCQVVDTLAGTTHVDFDLRGYNRPPPASGIAAAANFSFSDSSALPIKRLGAGQFFTFEVDARDLTGAGLTFEWSFAGSNNWTVPSYGNGTTVFQPDGGYRSLYQKDLTGEVITSGTSKVAVADCRVTNGTSRTDVMINVVLLKNNPPSGVSIVARDAVTHAVLNDLTQIPAGTLIQLEATPIDLDDDVVTFEWSVALTGSGVQIGTAFPLTYDVKGPKIIVSTVGATAGLQIGGTIVATDRVGGTDSVSLPNMVLV